MRWPVTLVLSLFVSCASPALAADQLQFGAAGAWVNPLAIPDTQARQPDAPVDVLLTDSQVRLEPGRISVYSETAMRIQQPAGLQAGSVAIQWSPELDEVTVHKVRIHRGAKEIDVLASGQKFQVLRREQNLDQAVLDGTLTAVLQPEGLQVGDILHVATTTSRRDPVLGHHSELISGMLPRISPKRARLRVEWPSTVRLRLQPHNMGEPKVGELEGTKFAEWRLDDPSPLVIPDDAPGRFQWDRQVEFTDFGSWSEIGVLLAPLYERASAIPKDGPLRIELERIRRSNSDRSARAQAALRLVQDKVRYVALQMGAGGLVPASAETTWNRRFGDCKAKTALLLGLLRELGISAVPVAVNAQSGDGLDKRLPLVALFDHVLVRATIDGRDYWLDGTRNNDPALGLIETPAFGWGLPLTRDAQLVRLMPRPAQRPTEETTIHMDARKGGSAPAPTKMEVVFRGDAAIAMNMLMSGLPLESRDETLKAFWKKRLSNVEVKSTDFAFDRDQGEFRLTMAGDAKLDLKKGRYWVDVPTPGYKPDFDRPPGPYQQAPFALNYPSFTKHKQTFLLPDEMTAPLHDADPIDRTVGGVRYRRTTVKNGASFVIESSSQVLGPELDYSAARAAEKDLRELDKEDFYVVLDKPTAKEIDGLLQEKTENVAELISRGAMLAWAGKYKESIAEYEKVIAKDPTNRQALEGRGFSRAQIGELKLARADYEAATKLGSKLPFLHVLAANEALERKDWAAALTELNKAIALAPEAPEVWMARAEINNRAGNEDAALADAAAAIRLYPNFAPAYLLRVNLFRQRNQPELALAETDALMKLTLSDPFGYVAAGKAYAALDRPEDAMRAFDKAIETKAEAYIFLNRAETRPRADIKGRKADIESGLRTEPDHPDLLVALASLQVEAGEREAAIATLQKVASADANDVYFRIRRGLIYSKLDQAARAEADFAYVRAEAEQDARVLNNMCWQKATENLALESALGDCDRAVSLDPNASGYHDSRGLVLLRLGRLDDAMAAYNRALEKKPFASALYGRALVWARKGEKVRAAADAAEAEKLSAKVRQRFAGYGLNL